MQKYKRFMTWFAAMYPLYFAIVIAAFMSDRPWVMWMVIGLVLALSTFWSVVVIKVWNRIKQLKLV